VVCAAQGLKRKASSLSSGDTSEARGTGPALATVTEVAREDSAPEGDVMQLAKGEEGKEVQTLHTLAALGKSDAVKAILSKHGTDNVNSRSSSGHTALEYALINGHEAVALSLLEAGAKDPWSGEVADPSQAASKGGLAHSGGSALLKAVVLASPTVAQALLARSPGLATVANRYGETPLHVAARVGQVETIRLLINVLRERHEHFEAAMAQDSKGNTPLHESAANSEVGARCVQLLLECNGKVLSMVNGNGQTPLHRAASLGHTKAVEVLLKNGADATLPDVDGLKPARLAHIHGHSEVASLLAQAYVDRLAANKAKDRDRKR